MNRYQDKKDNVLVEMTLLGDSEAFDALVLRHQNAVKGTAYKVTGNSFSAEDASQDAFVSAWVNLASLKDPSLFGSWVCSIAKNRAKSLVMHYRSVTADISLHLLENLDLDGEDASGLDALTGVVGVAEAMRDEQLHLYVDALSDKIREAIEMHYFKGLSVAEIAAKLSVPVGTVKWRLCEGRKQLRKEYGMIEKEYDENKTLVQRVREQVEHLKLWRIKNDKTGFESEYRAVLSSVESLEESGEKQHMLADVLILGYWWLPGQANDEVLAKIKASAIAGHNESVMQCVIPKEYAKYKGEERLAFMRDTQIPELERHGFVKAVGYTWFWYGCYSMDENHTEQGMDAYRKVLELLTPEDVYYANAQSALWVEQKKANAPKIEAFDRDGITYGTRGEVYQYVGKKLYFWEQPGYSRGGTAELNESLFWNTSLCDGLLYDPDLLPGQSVKASDGSMTLTCLENDVTVTVAAGTFAHCAVYEMVGNRYDTTYTKTVFAPGVGLIAQMTTRYSQTNSWELSHYKICGGEGIVPFAPGNRWEYVCTDKDSPFVYTAENYFEVTSYKNGRAVVSNGYFAQVTGYTDTWQGHILNARHNYIYPKDGKWLLRDVSGMMKRAAELAQTKRQKVHTAIAADVMQRIWDTDPDANPDFTEFGRWNFFTPYTLVRDKKGYTWDNNWRYSFEGKDMAKCADYEFCVLHNHLYSILEDATGYLWCDAWIPGYHLESKQVDYDGGGRRKVDLTLDVLDDCTVTVEAGTFEGCRHIAIDLRGLEATGLGYRGGKKEYWFAPGVGIVKMTALYKGDTLQDIWELTEYRGTGEGFFPAEDGMFRRYESKFSGNGVHASVEYTFDEENGEMVIFRNALGNQDRACWEAGPIEAPEEQWYKKSEA